MPLHGNWKTLLRVHDGRVLTAFPIYLPADEAIPAEAIDAEDGMTREAIPEIDILQRELKESGGGLWAVANLTVLACTLALIAAMSWGVGAVLPPGRRARAVPGHPGRRGDDGEQRARQQVRRSPLGSALLPVLVAGALSGCAGTDPGAAAGTGATSTSASSTPSDAAPRGAAGRLIVVQIAGGQVSGDTGRVPVAAGTEVTLSVTSDVADEVHVHGYDLEAELTPGAPAEITFDATVTGVFEVELHEAGTVLLSLQVVVTRSGPRGRVADRSPDPARPGALRRGRGDPDQLLRPAAVLAHARGSATRRRVVRCLRASNESSTPPRSGAACRRSRSRSPSSWSSWPSRARRTRATTWLRGCST